MRSPYRRSVWIDIFGIVLFGAVLLGGAGYLLYRAGSGAGGLAGGTSGGGTPTVGSAPQRSVGASRHPRGLASPRRGAGPLLGSRTVPSASGTQAPFSADWREGATPDVTVPSAASSGGDARGGGIRSASPEPSVTSSRPSGAHGRGDLRASETGGSSWRGEARQLAGRAQALSSQLRQMDRSSSEPGGTISSQKHASTSAAGTGASASGPGSPGDPSRRSGPGDPSSVPIDDHVYWLAIAGLLFGVWRLRGG